MEVEENLTRGPKQEQHDRVLSTAFYSSLPLFYLKVKAVWAHFSIRLGANVADVRHEGDNVRVTYAVDGKLHLVTARTVVMSAGWTPTWAENDGAKRLPMIPP